MDQDKNDGVKRASGKTLSELGDIVAFVGHEVQFSGVLTYKGNVRIDGTFEGEIETTDILFIGEQANVKAQIRAGSVIASGRIKGEIIADQRVELKSPAVIDASISTPKLSMDNGVIFNGKISMGPTVGQNKGTQGWGESNKGNQNKGDQNKNIKAVNPAPGTEDQSKAAGGASDAGTTESSDSEKQEPKEAAVKKS
jgi:cytoskeletal protein CcmA (bactofilin family)